jgi:hypothetical protein
VSNIVGRPEQEPINGRICLQYSSFIHQANSWAPIQTSADTLKKLLAAHAVCPIFLDALFAFGAKVTGDDDPYFNLCHQQDNDAGFGKHVLYMKVRWLSSVELCYLLRSYEKHNRSTLKNPWSLRQMAVYHKYDRQTATSVWIFIQPFKRCKLALWKEFPRTRCSSPKLYLHTLLISLTLRDWRWYLNDRRQFVSQFVSFLSVPMRSCLPTDLVRPRKQHTLPCVRNCVITKPALTTARDSNLQKIHFC